MSERDSAGRFLPGHAAVNKKAGAKHRITKRMLEAYERLEVEDSTMTPFKFWLYLLNDKIDFEDTSKREILSIKLKAAENMAKYVYDPSFGNEEVEQAPSLTPEQIEALKSAFPAFQK